MKNFFFETFSTKNINFLMKITAQTSEPSFILRSECRFALFKNLVTKNHEISKWKVRVLNWGLKSTVGKMALLDLSQILLLKTAFFEKKVLFFSFLKYDFKLKNSEKWHFSDDWQMAKIKALILRTPIFTFLTVVKNTKIGILEFLKRA